LTGNKVVLSQSIQKSTEQPKERIFWCPTSLPRTPEPLPEFKISCHISQLYPDAQKLFSFYLSCADSDQAHSSLTSTTWPTLIIRKALDSERHTLFLLCYITSLISYLNHSPRDGKVPKQGRNDSFSETSSCASSAPGFDDWLYSVSSKFQQDSYASQRPKLSIPYAWQHSDLPTSAQSWYTPPTSSFSQPFPTTLTTYSQSARHSFSSHKSVPALCSSIASNPIHLTHQAVSTLKSRLSTKHKSSPATEFLFPVWCLFRAAILQGDEFAAAAHERFLRHLVYKAEGVKDLPPWLIRVIIEVDLKLADADKSEDGEERSGGELLVESEMRERLKPECKGGSMEKEWWWDMGWS
jgi:hypothetical protein